MARVAELLAARGHQPLVIAPQPSRVKRSAREEKVRYPVVRVPAVPLPGYPGFRLGLPSLRLRNALIEHRAEVVHLASPVVLGAHGATVAKRLGLPIIAVFQTDLPSYAHADRRPGPARHSRGGGPRRIDNRTARTLAPSTVTATGLRATGSATCGCGAAATRPASTRPGAAPRSGPGWPRAGS